LVVAVVAVAVVAVVVEVEVVGTEVVEVAEVDGVVVVVEEQDWGRMGSSLAGVPLSQPEIKG
jgi:hypothetical protein